MIRSYILLLMLAGTSVVMGMDNKELILEPISEQTRKELGEILVNVAPEQEMKEIQAAARLEITDSSHGSVAAPDLEDPSRVPLVATFVGASVGFTYFLYTYVLSKYVHF